MSEVLNWDRQIASFLAQRRIAVAGVSRSSGEAANFIFRKLRDAGYDVFAVNPHAAEVEGVASHPDLESIRPPVEAVVIATPPEAATGLVRECAELGIRHVWMHRAFGAGSYSEEAAALARAHGIALVPGGCPMMFLEPVDVGHRCMRWFLRLTGALPRAA